MDERFLAVEGLTKTYNPGRPDEFQALREVSVSFRRGEVAVLKGPSGSGKTTLLSLLGCMSRPTAGRVLVEGRDVAKLPEPFLTEVRRRTFGFIFQHFYLVKGLSVLENVLLPLVPEPVAFADMRRRAEAVLARLGLWDRRRVKASRLSGGEQQRVAVARALIADPPILVADEPTAHLDGALAADLLGLLGELNREGKTVIVATHDPLVYGNPLVHRVIELRGGRVAAAEDR